jgi:signal transduction histidine kinase
MADADRLMQVLINLLSNAIKFVPAGSGRVQLALIETASGVRFTVSDNGPGIAASQQALIFEKFRQAEGESLPSGGTGLGLPISRQIVEHFGGHLWVRSGVPPAGETVQDGTGPWTGAVFGVDLPWQDQGTPTTRSGAATP